MTKKVGIFTIWGGANYGNRLQNYAVQEVVRSLGYAPVTFENVTQRGYLDFPDRRLTLRDKLRPSYIRAYLQTRLFEKFTAKNDRDFTVARLWYAGKHRKEIEEKKRERRAAFLSFLNETMTMYEHPVDLTSIEAEDLSDFTAFITGSDQVWNPYYRQNSAIDFLRFAPKHQRITFSPSFGVTEIPEERAEIYRELLNGFERISVREESGAEIVRKLTGREATVLLDPTMMLDAEQWRRIAKRPSVLPDRPYIFCYFLGNRTKRYGKRIEALAKRNDWAIVDACDIFDADHYACPPSEFVYLLDHASCVCTDSFHGAVFSILFQKPFTAFARSDGKVMHSRLTTLLNKFGLADRLYSGGELSDKTEFLHTEAILETERQRAKEFLQTCFAEAEATGRERNVPQLAMQDTCTGCAACANACPKDCIAMQPDSEGFLRPSIDRSACIGCGLCRKTCPILHRRNARQEWPKAYALYAKDAELVKNSSSGGAFSLVAESILERGGTVFGAALTEENCVRHIAVSSVQELSRLRTSKYVQSEIGNSYREAEALLREGQTVLFTGTSCQIAGLYAYLQKPYPKLYTQDILCHGVPSPKVWETYLKQVHPDREKKNISFRDKTHGWNSFGMRVDGYQRVLTKDAYLAAFLGNLDLRPNCHRCVYKTAARDSDLTLADFWGVETVLPGWKEQQGVSLVLVQSERGERLLEAVAAKAVLTEVDAKRALGLNHAALHSVKAHPKRREFFERLETEPMEPLVRRSLRLPFGRRVKRTVRRALSKIKHFICR